jgi:lysophospholipase L1-like esterase
LWPVDNVAMSRTYYALGDSMSIDAYAGGPGQGAASLLADDFGYSLRMLAADGATSHSVVTQQLPAIDSQPHLVTLTMGGNDLVEAVFRDPATVEGAIDKVGEHADIVLRTLRAKSTPTTPIVVTTVYDPTDGTGDLGAAGFPPWPEGLAVLDRLNATLRAAAQRHGALVADVHARFLGHGLTVGDVTQPDPRPEPRELWYCGTIEPNAWGAIAIRDAWRAALDRPQ